MGYAKLSNCHFQIHSLTPQGAATNGLTFAFHKSFWSV
jgi:hypothetical protein